MSLHPAAGGERPATAAGASRRDVMAMMLIFGVIAVVFADVLFFGNQFAFRDLTRFYFPAKHILRDVVLHGEFPFWNRYFAGGQPLAANPEFEVFYPPQWLIFLPDYALGFRLHILVHFAIAAAGMYQFMRSRTRSAAASAFAALSFVFAGYFLSTVNLLPILFVIVWIPWVLLFVRRFLLASRRRDFALAALFVGMQCLAGEPVSLIESCVLVGFYALFEGWRKERSLVSLLRNGALAALIVAGGAGVGLAQLLPAVGHVHDSVRSRGLGYREVTQWSMPLVRPLELFAPKLFGAPELGVYWGAGLYPLRRSPFYISIYFGLIGIVLSAAAMLARMRGALAVGALSIMGYALAIGANGSLHGILYDIGVGQFARYPEKFILLALIPLTILAADALDGLLGGERRVRNAAIACCAVVAMIALALVVFSARSGFRQRVFALGSATGDFAAIAGLGREQMVILLVKAAVLALLVVSASRLRRELFLAGLALFWAVDLLPLSRDVLPRVPARFFDAPPAVGPLAAYLRGDRLFHEGDFWTAHNRPNAYDRSPARDWMTRNALLPMLPARWGISMALDLDYDRTALLDTAEFSALFAETMREGRRGAADLMLAWSNVRGRAVYRDFQSQVSALAANPEAVTPVAVLPVTGNARYRFADALVPVTGVDDLRDKLWGRPWSRGTAFVPFTPFAIASGRVLSARETANTASVEVEAPGPALLVASVTYHKYWTATVDGAPAQVRPVNVTYQGVMVPRGRHVVAFRYRNPLVIGGAAGSLLSVVLLLAIAVVEPHRRSGPHHVERDGDDHE